MESGGRLDAETDYYNKFNNRGEPSKKDPTCLACSDGPASGGEKLLSCSNTSVSGASMSVTDIVKPFDPPDVSLSEETSGGGSAEIFIITPQRAGSDIISKENLKATLQIHEHISNIKVCLDSETGERLNCERDCTPGMEAVQVERAPSLVGIGWTQMVKCGDLRCAQRSPPMA